MSGTGPRITIARKSGVAAMLARVFGTNRLGAYVGIPAEASVRRSNSLLKMAGAAKIEAKTRRQQLLEKASKAKDEKARSRLRKAAQDDINNAELLFIFSKGSPVRKQPPRPVLEPSVQDSENKPRIERELAASAKAAIRGDKPEAVKKMRRASVAGQNAARGWFTNPKNHWAPLADSTIRGRVRKMSDVQVTRALEMELEEDKSAFTPGVDTGAMRAAIQGLVDEK